MSATTLLTTTVARVRKMKAFGLAGTIRRSHPTPRLASTTCIPRKRSIELARNILTPRPCKNKQLLCKSNAPAASFTQSAVSRTVKRCISVPRRLPRPTFSEISNEKLVSIDPSLAGIPAQYVRDKLQEFGAEMLSSVAQSSTHITESLSADGTLPRDVPAFPSSIPNAPTHVFAIASSSSQPRKTYTLYPVHASIMTSHCSRLPILPTTSSSSTSCDASEDTPAPIPVIPLRLPHAPSFPLLQTYLYTKRADFLTSSLRSSPSRMATITGLWRNACMLGIADEGLWQVLDSAWAEVTQSMARASS